MSAPHRSLQGLLAASVVAGALGAGAADAETIRMLKTWDERYPGSTVICDRYAELLEEASGGDIEVAMSGPETIPPLDQLEPTQNGLFQVLCTYPGFHTGATTLLTGLEGVRPDPAALRSSDAPGVIEASYAKLGVHVLAVPLAHGYWIYLNREMPASGDLDGLQIRALPPQHAYIESLGGVPVVLPPAEMFSALERGVVDGALFPAAGATGYGFAEVTERYFDTGATAPHVLLANADFWDGLDPAAREAFESAATTLEDEIPGVYDRLNAEEAEKMQAAGMELVTLGDAPAATLSDAIVSGAWDFAGSLDPEAAGSLREAVEGTDLLLNR